jgi:hypothetical protein
MERANPKGYGSPDIRIWDSNGKVQIDNIDKFVFKYSEDNDDVCTLTFTTKDLYIRDQAPFQADARWKIQWGYKSSPEFPEGLYSNVRTMYVRDIKSTYDTRGVTMTINLSNLASYLRQMDSRGNGMMQNVTLGDVATSFADGLGLQIKLDEDAIIDGNGQLQIKAHRKNDLVSDLTFASFLNAQLKAKDKDASRLGLNTKSGGTLDPSKPLGIKDLPDTFVLREDMFMGNSHWQTLKQMIREEAMPGINLVGRDDLLILTYRNLNKKPIHTYVFEGPQDGELLSFSPEERRYKKSKTNFKVLTAQRLIKGATVNFITQADLNTWSGKDAMKHNNLIIGPEEYALFESILPALREGEENRVKVPDDIKRLIEKDVNTILEGSNIELVLIPLNIEGKRVKLDKAGNQVNNLALSGYYEAYIEVVGNRQFSRASGNTRDPELNRLNPQQLDSYIIKNVTANYSKKESEKTAIPLGEATNRIDGTSAPSIQGTLIPLRKFLPVGTNEANVAANQALNDLDEAENDTNPANFKAIGQPNMESEQVIVINNVAKRDAGRYWIKELTHTINRSGGYIMEGELTRNAVNKSGTELEGRVPDDNQVDDRRTIDETPEPNTVN